MRLGYVLVSCAILLVSCEMAPTLGASCDRNAQCGAPLVCRFGRCRSECAAQRDCPFGTTCLLDASGAGSCALRDDPDCSAPGGSCEAPLACVGRECVNVCTLGPECPAGSACVPIGDGRARCVRTDGVDASVMDGDTVDASMPVDAPRGDANLCTPMGTGSGPCDTALDLALGDGCACVRTTMGHVWCWGTNRSIARDGDTRGCTSVNAQDWACPTPTLMRAQDPGGAVVDAHDVMQLDMDDIGGCLVSRTGVVSCWGTIDYEAPLGGVSGTGERARPILGTSLPLFDRVAVFDGSALAIAHDGIAWWGWGNDNGDVLRHGSVAAMFTPTALTTAPMVRFATVATGPHHGCGIDATGQVLCWGANDFGQANPVTPSATPVAPTPIAGVTNATQLVAGPTHSCALADEGFVCWGGREHIYFDGDVTSCHTTDTNCGPTVVPTGSLVIAQLWPARNSDDFCATDAAGSLYCWGASYGTFGHAPTLVPGLPPVASAMITWTHACALTTDSDVWCWGENESGELGRGTVDPTGVLPPALVLFQ